MSAAAAAEIRAGQNVRLGSVMHRASRDVLGSDARCGWQSLHRLLAIAQGDTHQSRYVRDFLLAWWNHQVFGGFEIHTLWAVDGAIAEDILRVLHFISVFHAYPDSLGLGDVFADLIKRRQAA
jgi:hypothetical protein